MRYGKLIGMGAGLLLLATASQANPWYGEICGEVTANLVGTQTNHGKTESVGQLSLLAEAPITAQYAGELSQFAKLEPGQEICASAVLILDANGKASFYLVRLLDVK